MSVSYRLISARDLDSTLIENWRSIQANNPEFESPYFCPEFTQLVGSVRDDVRVVVIENSGRPVGFFPHQRTVWGHGKPVGGPLSDYHGVIAGRDSEWSLVELMRTAKLSAWTFDHLVDMSERFEPYTTARVTSPQIDLVNGFEQYMQELGSPPQDFARKARKMAREIGDLTLTFHDGGSDPMNRMIRWKEEQYRKSQFLNAFGVRWTGELLRKVMEVQTREFAGVCSVLIAGDQVVAIHAGIRSRHVLHWWFPTYAQEFSRYSPGMILLFRVAEAMVAKGLRTIDLGKGDDPYKRSVMTGAAELREGFVELPSLLASARQLRRAAGARAARGGLGAPLRLPLKAISRIEWARKFR